MLQSLCNSSQLHDEGLTLTFFPTVKGALLLGLGVPCRGVPSVTGVIDPLLLGEFSSISGLVGIRWSGRPGMTMRLDTLW